MISREFAKLSNMDIAGFIIEPDEDENMNINVTMAVESSSDLWILANMKQSKYSFS